MVVCVFGALFDVELVLLVLLREQQVKYAYFELLVNPSVADVSVKQGLILVCYDFHAELCLFKLIILDLILNDSTIL